MCVRTRQERLELRRALHISCVVGLRLLSILHIFDKFALGLQDLYVANEILFCVANLILERLHPDAAGVSVFVRLY